MRGNSIAHKMSGTVKEILGTALYGYTCSVFSVSAICATVVQVFCFSLSELLSYILGFIVHYSLPFSCSSIGCTVAGKHPRDVQKEIDSGDIVIEDYEAPAEEAEE